MGKNKKKKSEIGIGSVIERYNEARRKYYVGLRMLISCCVIDAIAVAVLVFAIINHIYVFVLVLVIACAIGTAINAVYFSGVKNDYEYAKDEKEKAEKKYLSKQKKLYPDKTEAELEKRNPFSPDNKLPGHYELLKIEGGETAREIKKAVNKIGGNPQFDIGYDFVGYEDNLVFKIKYVFDPDTEKTRVVKQNVKATGVSGGKNYEIKEEEFDYRLNEGILTIIRDEDFYMIYKKKKLKQNRSFAGGVASIAAVTLFEIFTDK